MAAPQRNMPPPLKRRPKDKFWPITTHCSSRSHPGVGCASFSANHQYTRYHDDPRSRFTYKCPFCKAFLLESEMPVKGRPPTKCCRNGDLHTPTMITDWNQLQDPPNYIRNYSDKGFDEGKKFVDNAKAINSFCAFASITTRQDPEARGMCKINGEVNSTFGDLFPRQGLSAKVFNTFVLALLRLFVRCYGAICSALHARSGSCSHCG